MFFTRKSQSQGGTVLGLDLGTSGLKAAVVRRDNDRLALAEYAVRKLPAVTDKALTPAQLAAEVQQLLGQLKSGDRYAVVTLSCPSAMVCHAEVPRMPLPEVRTALKLNSTRYLRRDFSNFHLDAVEIPEHGGDGKTKKSTLRVLVGGASRDEITGYRNVLTEAKVRPVAVELTAISVVNAFQINHADLCAKEAVMVLDIGARSTTINCLRHGAPVMTRIMHFGGAQLSEYVAQVLTLKPAEAEEEKVQMSEPVQALIRTAMAPLARELRASIDFFERQEECHMSHAFAGGGSALSPAILQYLGEEVGIKVERWDPLHNLELGQVAGDPATLKAESPVLAAAVGAAVARLAG